MSNKIASSQQQPPTPTSIGSAASTPPPASAGTSGASHSGLITGLQKDEIINAIIGSNLELLKRLVTPELVNIKDRSGNTLLHLATNNQRTAIAKWLVSQGADVNAHCNGHTVLATALNHANYELFDFFLAHKAECIGRNQLNLVHEAVQQQRADIVNTLIGRGADPNLYNSAHLTPLSIACMNRNLEISLILMENGACANLPDKKGNTALHVACGSLDAGLIECLLANTECDLRLKNVQDETPLDQLFLGYLRDTRRPSEELVRRLVRAGALFSMPWNFALTSANASCLILFFAILCKLEAPSLASLFLNDKPFFTDLIVRGYWPNALLVALRASIIEPHFKTGQVELRDLMASIELIAQTQHFHLRSSDLLSTLYVCEEAANDPSTPTTDYQLFRHVRELYTKGVPLALKILCRNTIRTHMARANPIDSAAASSAAASSDDYELEAMQRVERLVYSLDATAELEPHTIKSLVQFLTLADYDLK